MLYEKSLVLLIQTKLHNNHRGMLQFIGNLTFSRDIIFDDWGLAEWNECDFMCVWFSGVSLGAFVCGNGWWVGWCECNSWTICGSLVVSYEKGFRVWVWRWLWIIRKCFSYRVSLAWKSAPTVMLRGFLKSHSTWNAASPVVTSSGSCCTTTTLEKTSPSCSVWHWPSGNFIVSDRAPLPSIKHGALCL